MAITLSALDMFRNASAWTDNTKLNLNGQGGVDNADGMWKFGNEQYPVSVSSHIEHWC